MDYPMIDGQMVSFAEIEIRAFIFGGSKFETKDFSAVDWDDSLEGEEVYGAGPDKLGDTTGQYKAAGSMTMYRIKALDFMSELARAKPTASGIGIVRFDLIINWSPLDAIGRVITTELLGCRIKQRQSSNATGTAAGTIVLPLMITKILEDGVALI